MNIRPKLSWSDLRGTRVGIWGLGVEGHANLRRLQVLGVTPILVDDAGSADFEALKTDEGGLDALSTCDVVVKSPGISRYRRELRSLEEAGVPVVGGLGLWMAEADRSRVACITGTKGKSTTTSIAGHLLNRLGYRCFLGGNLGSPPWDPLVPSDADFWLIETSSYQATDVATGPQVVAVTSLHPDHLNWHGGVEAYFSDKLSLATLPGVGRVVANSEDGLVVSHRKALGENVRWVPDANVSTDWTIPLGLLGRHNEINAQIAQAVMQELGIEQAHDSAALASAAGGFAQLASRLQVIGSVAGRTFVDDSLSTNVLPTLAALEAFPDRKVALIVGGFDRDIDYGSLALDLRRRQSPVLVLAVPDNGPRIARTLAETGAGPHVEVRLAAGVKEATQLGYDWAQAGGVVLLSPAAPSFGLFRITVSGPVPSLTPCWRAVRPPLTELDSGFIAELVEIAGGQHVLTDPAALRGFNTDWTGRFDGNAAAVVRPGSTEEVAAIITACVRHGCPVTAQGGNTGLVGGGVTLAGGVVLSTRRLDDVVVDSTAGQVIAGAGATLASVQHSALREAGLTYGVDLASRDTATIAGTIATNAGGLRVLRRGDTRAQVIGVQAVLGDGSVVSHLAGLARDNTGYHLPSLLCGSEGTLAVITRARLRLSDQPAARAVALFALASAKAAAAAALQLRREPTVQAVELMLQPGLALVCAVTGLPAPFPQPHEAYLLVEVAATEPFAALETIVEHLTARDVAIGSDASSQRTLWAYRERHTEAINTLGPPHKLDVTLPLDAFPHFVDTVPRVVADTRPDARVWLFGHAAEASVHVNISGLEPADEDADDAVMRYVAELGGSISAEHGIGRAKVRWIALNRSAAELAAFRNLKNALDPMGILNPGVLLRV